MPDSTLLPGARRLRLPLLAVVLAAIMLSLFVFPVGSWVLAAEQWNQTHPVAGPTAFVAVAAVAAVLFVPGSLIAMSAGYVYGFLLGVPLGLVAVSAGALAALLAGRFLVREWAAARINRSARLTALDRAVGDSAFLLATLTRLSLIIPFNVLNYAFGATGIRKMPYFLGTAVGMIPATLLYVYLGTLARNFDDIRSGRLGDELPGGLILAFGLLVIGFAALIVQRRASRALRQRLGE